jgi:hypothetical protein
MAIFGTLVLLAPVIGLTWNFAFDFPRQRQALQERHREARPIIEFAYAHFAQHGRWPQPTEIEEAGHRLSSSNWEYAIDSADGPPVIWQHGPYHMIISYRFTRPAAENSDLWILSVEGSKSEFRADSPYR